MPSVKHFRVNCPAMNIDIDANVAAASASATSPTGGSSTLAAKKPRSSEPDHAPYDGPREDNSEVASIRMEGKIRSWEYDWGFITSPDYFERDLFVHKNQLQFAAPHA